MWHLLTFAVVSLIFCAESGSRQESASRWYSLAVHCDPPPVLLCKVVFWFACQSAVDCLRSGNLSSLATPESEEV